MKEWLDCCMDFCSFHKYGRDVGLWKAFLSIKNYFYQHQNIIITIKGESETCPISEIAIVILSLKFISSFEAATFSFTNLFFPPSRFSLLSSGNSVCCLPHFAPTASRKKRAAKKLACKQAHLFWYREPAKWGKESLHVSYWFLNSASREVSSWHFTCIR